MRYKDLHELINSSSSARRYFLSLPVNMQIALHGHNDYIHSAHELHLKADVIEKFERSCDIRNRGF